MFENLNKRLQSYQGFTGQNKKEDDEMRALAGGSVGGFKEPVVEKQIKLPTMVAQQSSNTNNYIPDDAKTGVKELDNRKNFLANSIDSLIDNYIKTNNIRTDGDYSIDPNDLPPEYKQYAEEMQDIKQKMMGMPRYK